ncbi:MAG: hypothetical protein AB2693_17570 [Candidatus Thiodiazotropha sp.]
MAKPPWFLLLDRGQELIIFFNGCLDLSANLLIGYMVLVQNVQYPSVTSKAFLFSNFAVMVRDSQANRKMEMTRECISFTFDPKDVLSQQIVFSFVRTEVACAILEKTSCLESSFQTFAPRYLKLVKVLTFCLVTLFCLGMTLALFVITQFGSLSADLHLIPYVIVKPQIGKISAAYANSNAMLFKSTRHDPFDKC